VSQGTDAFTSAFEPFAGGSTSSGSYPTGYHQLVVQNSGLCADVAGASVSNGAAIDQWTCKTSGQANQEFQFNPVSGGYGELQNQNSGSDVAVFGASTAAGASVIQYTQNGTANSLWQPIALSDGTWQFKNEKSGLCLDMTGNSTSANTQFEQWRRHGGVPGRWTEVPDGPSSTASRQDGCADLIDRSSPSVDSESALKNRRKAPKRAEFLMSPTPTGERRCTPGERRRHSSRLSRERWSPGDS
jgi:hypothetical protein